MLHTAVRLVQIQHMHLDNVHGISASGVNIVEFDLKD